jgi:hypothetical protein
MDATAVCKVPHVDVGFVYEHASELSALRRRASGRARSAIPFHLHRFTSGSWQARVRPRPPHRDARKVPSIMSLTPAELAGGALGTGYALPIAQSGPTTASILASMSPQTREYTKRIMNLTFAQLAAGAGGLTNAVPNTTTSGPVPASTGVPPSGFLNGITATPTVVPSTTVASTGVPPSGFLNGVTRPQPPGEHRRPDVLAVSGPAQLRARHRPSRSSGFDSRCNDSHNQDPAGRRSDDRR